jgi:hypothetical protein
MRVSTHLQLRPVSIVIISIIIFIMTVLTRNFNLGSRYPSQFAVSTFRCVADMLFLLSLTRSRHQLAHLLSCSSL